MEDAGPTFRAADDAETWDLDVWTALVTRFTRLQRMAEPLVEVCLATVNRATSWDRALGEEARPAR